MTYRPILFSAAMIRAILAGTKTQTRRVMKPQPSRVDGGVPFGDAPAWAHAEPGSMMMRCPYGKRGDRLWVRETFDWDGDDPNTIHYRATHDSAFDCFITRWRPSIHMPRWASRITLDVTGGRVERLQDISEADAIAEGGVEVAGGWWSHDGTTMKSPGDTHFGGTAIDSYRLLWDQINGPGAWDANPFVWVIEFKWVTP